MNQYEIATETLNAQRFSLKVSVKSVKICDSVAVKMSFLRIASLLNSSKFSNISSLTKVESSFPIDFTPRLCVSARNK